MLFQMFGLNQNSPTFKSQVLCGKKLLKELSYPHHFYEENIWFSECFEANNPG